MDDYPFYYIGVRGSGNFTLSQLTEAQVLQPKLLEQKQIYDSLFKDLDTYDISY